MDPIDYILGNDQAVMVYLGMARGIPVGDGRFWYFYGDVEWAFRYARDVVGGRCLVIAVCQ